MKRHKWGKPTAHPPGAIQICQRCGRIRITTIPGYQRSAVGECPGKPIDKREPRPVTEP